MCGDKKDKNDCKTPNDLSEMSKTISKKKEGEDSFARRFSQSVGRLLDGNVQPIYIIDPDSFEVMYCNSAMRDYIPRDPVGKPCYRFMRGKAAPCESCVAMELYRERRFTPKEYQYQPGAWALLQASLLHWDGRELIQITCMDITKQKLLEEELRLRNKEYSAMIQQSHTGIMRYDILADSAFINVDRHLNRVAEYAIPNFSKVVCDVGMVDPESVPVAKRLLSDVREGRVNQCYDILLHIEQKGKRWYHVDYAFVDEVGGRPSRAVFSFFDNTEQREQELEYQKWNERLNTVMNEYTAYMEVNLTKDQIEIDRRLDAKERNVGNRSFSEVKEETARISVLEEDRHKFRTFYNRERLLGQFYEGNNEGTLEYRVISEDGYQWYKSELQMTRDPSSDDIKAIILLSNVNDVMKEKERLKNEAERDAMTGLYNHAAAESVINDILSRNSGEQCCFLIIDLDDLREINNSLGHLEGDRALKAIAGCMKAKFRKSDILGRVGGDEFVAFLRDVRDGAGLLTTLSNFMSCVNAKMIGPKNDRQVRASIGAVIGTAGRDCFEALYAKADLALYYTKAMGKNGFHFYRAELEKRDFVYQYSSPETLAEAIRSESKDLDRLLRAMSEFFPLVISANLTKNSYHMMEYKSYQTKRVHGEGVFDLLIEKGVRTFHIEDRESFLKCFERQNLLKAFREGRRIIRHVGRQLGDDGIYRRVQTVVILMEDGESEDVYDITFSNVLPE